VGLKMRPIYFTPTFQKNLRQLGKKYRHIRQDIEPIIQQLQAGEVLGDQIAHSDCELYKLRVCNSDIQKGKSAGYRIIYLKTIESTLLVTMYSKLEQGSIEISKLKEIIEKYND
jgi:mRNA-degrading endonuclease RelE of RelBE toxin-antitoxin system